MAQPRRRAPVARKNPLTVKAAGASASDTDVISATIADASAGRTSTRDQEWFCYEKHPWVRACVRLIANAVSQEGFSVAAIDGASHTVVTAEADPRVKEILQFFRYAFAGKSLRTALVALVTDLEVFGLAYWLIRRQGELVWYERMDPRLTTPVLNADHTEIASYILKRAMASGVGALMTIDAASAKTVNAKEVIRFAFEGGDTVFGGPSPLEALDLTVSMDLSIRHHRNAFFQNGATHGTYVILPEASEEQVEEFTKSLKTLKGGAAKAYSPIVIGGNADVKRFSDSGKQEIDFIKGSELTRDEVAAVYSVPLGKLMFSGGALGSSGKSEDDDTFQRDCVLPIEELIYETLTAEIILKEFEIDDLALIPKRRALVRTDRFPACLSLVKFGGTANEARELAGLPKVDDPKMDEPLFIGAVGATSADPGLTPEAAPTEPAPDQSTGQVEGANTAQDAKTKEDGVTTRKGASSRFQHLRRRLDIVTQRAIAAHEGKLAAKLIACRHAFERDFWRRAGDVKASATAPKPITYFEVLALTRAIMDTEGDESYSDALFDSSEVLVELGWSQGKSILDLTTGFDVVPTATLRRVRDDINAYESKLVGAERDTVRNVLVQAFTDGLSVEQTKNLIKESFADGVHATDDNGNVVRTMPLEAWSQMVARSELSQAANIGMMDLYSDAGIEKISWISSMGISACEDCTDTDGEVVSLGESFPNVDVDAPPAHPNCAPAGTLILTDCGLIPIEDIKIGDRVLTHRLRFQRVLRRTSNVVSEDLIELRVGSNVLRVTGNHPIYTGDNWIPATSFKPGDKVASLNGFTGEVPVVKGTDLGVEKPSCWHNTAIVPLEAVERYAFSGAVYNFAVEEDESYVAEGIIVHNCVCSTAPSDDDLGDFRTGGQDQSEWAARGGRTKEDFIRDFKFQHPLDDDE